MIHDSNVIMYTQGQYVIITHLENGQRGQNSILKDVGGENILLYIAIMVTVVAKGQMSTPSTSLMKPCDHI